MPVYKLKIIKKPLSERIPDIAPRFGKLDNLHLDLLENKKKLKPGLPLVPIRKIIVKPAPQSVATQHTTQHTNLKENDSIENQDPDKITEDDLIKELGISDDEHDNDDNHDNEHDDNHDNNREQQEEPDEDDPNEGEPQLSPEEQEEDDRREYLVRFKILKKQNQNFDFPNYTEHTDFHTLKRIYNDCVRLIDLETNVDNYKIYLAAGFMGIELLACKMGLDFKDFAKIQLRKREKYDRLLVELGEKSYANFAANWPVELRLLGIILFDAGIFYLGKLISQHGGEGVGELFGLIFGHPTKKQKKKPKMRGPSTKPDDIRKMASKSD